MKTIYLLILICLTSCGIDEQNKNNNLQYNHRYPLPDKNWNDFEDYITEFLSLAVQYNLPTNNINKLRIVETEDRGEKFEGTELGTCLKTTLNDDIYYTKIVISQNYYFMYYGLPQFKLLIFHELGHCILNAKHSTDKKTLMYPQVYLYTDNEANDIITKFFREFDFSQIELKEMPLIQ